MKLLWNLNLIQKVMISLIRHKDRQLVVKKFKQRTNFDFVTQVYKIN